MIRARPFVYPLAATLLLALVPAAHGQDARQAAVRAVAESIIGADIHRDALVLASDANRGRATPSPGFDSAAVHIERTLRQLGVRPFGDDGTYRQYYTVTRVTLDTAATTAFVEWPAADRPVTQRVDIRYGEDFLLAGALITGVREGGIVYLGDFFRARARNPNADPYAGLDIRGKWLLVHATPPNLALAVDARRRGALGFLLVPSAANLGSWQQTRARVPTYRDLNPAHGVAYSQFPLPQVTLSLRALSVITPRGVGTAAMLAADSTQLYPAPAVFPGSSFGLDTRGTEESVRPFNVVAIIDGSDPQLREEYITVASHLDGAVGRGANTQGDSIFNAADDNASGSAGNMALARALVRAPRPKRSIVLIWDSGEEVGLWGTRYMAHSAIVPKIVAHFNVDMIGRTRVPGTSVLGEDELTGPDTVFVAGPRVLSTHMDSVTARVAREFNYIAYDRRFDRAEASFFYPRTDAAPYLERGIPYIEFFTGLHGDYHRQTDEPQKLDPKKMEAVTRAAFVTLWTLADDPTRPRVDKPWPTNVPLIR